MHENDFRPKYVTSSCQAVTNVETNHQVMHGKCSKIGYSHLLAGGSRGVVTISPHRPLSSEGERDKESQFYLGESRVPLKSK